MKMKCCEYGFWVGIQQNFIFFATYDLAQPAGVLLNTRLERLASDQHSNLLPVCQLWWEWSNVNTVPGLEFNQNLILFATYELAQQPRVLPKTRLERLASGNTLTYEAIHKLRWKWSIVNSPWVGIQQKT